MHIAQGFRQGWPLAMDCCALSIRGYTLVRKPTVCLMFMRRRRVRAEFDTFSDLQRQKLGSFMRIYRICLHKTAQLVTL